MKQRKNIEEILIGIQRGDTTCQRALLSQYADMLYAVSLRYVRDSNLAQEVVQDTFIKVFKASKNFDPTKGSFDGWIRKIAIHIALRYLNKKQIKLTLVEEHTHDDYGMHPEVLQKLDNDALMNIVQSLPEGYRQVFNLYVIEGYSHKEIAAMIGIKEVSSRSNLSRAKELLRNKLMTHKSYTSWATAK